MVIDQYKDIVDALINSKTSPATLPHEFIFDFKYNNLEKFRNEYLAQAQWLSLRSHPNISLLPKISASKRADIYKIEKYERDMILNDLKFATHIMMSKYSEPTNSRRFVATNDSCLSFTQVTVDPENYRWVFVSRSTEVNKMLPADLYTIGNIIDRWTDWFIDYNPAHFDPLRGVRILFILNNPHYYK